MDSYIDIQLLPDPEFSAPLLMGALYSKLHRALVTMKAGNIGVSFPGYQLKPKTLGSVLRIHGNSDALNALLSTNWLKGMSDHSTVTDVQEVPSDAGYQQVRRRQYKTSAERLRRRRMTRKGESYEEALLAIPDSVEEKPSLPFLTLRSLSTGQTFCLFIDQSVAESPIQGEFSCYGLSSQATVPHF